MATALENLLARRDAITAELAAMSVTAAGGQPTYSIEGQSVQHTEYRLSLYEELNRLNLTLGQADGKFDITSEVG